MIKTKVAFIRPIRAIEKYLKSSDWVEKTDLIKKPLLFRSCKQAKYRIDYRIKVLHFVIRIHKTV